jgi:membrane-bound metal-dependent hydrolase YbcI (DUF457 family)
MAESAIIETFMASPIGHMLAGIAVAWVADLGPGQNRSRPALHQVSWSRRAGGGLALAAAFLASAPDLDLLVAGFHRTATHSLVSSFVVALVAGLIAARARLPVARVAAVCGVAWGTHMALDWLSADQSTPNGLQILWPFSDTWFISGWDVFAGAERREFLSAATIRRNLATIVQEIVILAPVVLGVWLVRVKALAGLASQAAGRDHATE